MRNTGDRPIQVGSHFHFFEVNRALEFDRKAAFGQRLDIPASTGLRFEPGDQKEVTLVPFGGKQRIYGFNNLVDGWTGTGPTPGVPAESQQRIETRRRAWIQVHGQKAMMHTSNPIRDTELAKTAKKEKHTNVTNIS